MPMLTPNGSAWILGAGMWKLKNLEGRWFNMGLVWFSHGFSMFSEGIAVPYLPPLPSLQTRQGLLAQGAPSYHWFVVGRVLQGTGSSSIAIVLAISRDCYGKEEERLKASDWWVATQIGPPSAALADSFVTTKGQDSVFAAFACMWYHGIIWYYMVLYGIIWYFFL